MTEQTATPATEAQLVPWLRRALSAPTVKLGLILALTLVLQLPLSMVDGVISERQERQATVLAQFRSSWGPEQTLASPVLVVPFEVPADPLARRAHALGSVQIAANRLSVAATLQPQTRRRGFFTATVYTADVKVDGGFVVPDLAPPAQPGAELHWHDAYVLMSASNLGNGAAGDITVDGRTLTLEPAPDTAYCGEAATVMARLPLDTPLEPGAKLGFSQHLNLSGTEAFRVASRARQTDMTLAAPWATPSFLGDVPPLSYTVSDHDFTASWQIAASVAASRPRWASDGAGACGMAGPSADAQPGVELLDAVPTYRMVARAAKYANLFLLLAFLTYFLFETASGLRIHLVQYGLLGLSISLFALLLVSLGEPLGFTAAYGISTALVLLQASLFTRSVVRRWRPSLVFGAVLAGLFGFLYVVLSLETYALLVGTGAVFAALSAVMLMTRRIRWSA